MKKTLWTLCMALAVVFGTSMIFTGCSNNNGDDTSATENTETDRSSTDKDSVADDVGDAADDIIDGAEDAVDDIANGFDNYGDAHDYLLNQLGNILVISKNLFACGHTAGAGHRIHSVCFRNGEISNQDMTAG